MQTWLTRSQEGLDGRSYRCPSADLATLAEAIADRFRRDGFAVSVTHELGTWEVRTRKSDNWRIAFGMVYNGARISLSERGRELASLRILGFSRRDVAAMLLGEQAVLTALAIPLGFLIGWSLCVLIVLRFQSELFRIPLVVSRFTYAFAFVVVAVIMLIYVLLGTAMEELSMILLTVPIFFPLIVHMGLDPIWFGVLIVVVVEIGLISPPVGMNLFVLKTLIPQVSTGTVFRGVMPFFVADVVRLAILIAFPAISLWLPSLMK